MSSRVSRWIALAGATFLAVLLLAGMFALVAGAEPPAPAEAAEKGSPEVKAAAAAWSSGWITIIPGSYGVYYHNLGHPAEDYAVEMLFRDADGGLGIHRRFYGGADDSLGEYGAHWLNLTTNSIRVHRWSGDTTADEILIRVWVQTPAPEYDSGWITVEPAQTVTLTHGLGHAATDLAVSLWFSSSAGAGINHFGYGGLAYDATKNLYGGYWHNLTDNTVQVTRLAGASSTAWMRVAVTQSAAPAYDSLVALGGWQDVAAGAAFTFVHNLHSRPEQLLVRAECRSPDPELGIHQAFAGGEFDWRLPGWQGSNLQNISEYSVSVYRQPQDTLCPQMRVVIFQLGHSLYMPLVMRSHSGP